MRKRIIPIVLVIAVAAGIGYYWWTNYGGGSAAANAALGGSGTIEAQQIAVTPQTTGRIIAAPAEEGAAVKTGDVLYRLDPSRDQAPAREPRHGHHARPWPTTTTSRTTAHRRGPTSRPPRRSGSRPFWPRR